MAPVYSLSLLLGLAGRALAECSRATLQDIAATYVKAQTAGRPELLSLASNASYAENDVSMDIKKGVLSQALPVDNTRSLLDPVECATFTEITSATAKHPYVIHTRMLVTDSKISAIESVVTDDGDWVFNATGHLYWSKRETWDPIPEARRDTRAVIKAAGDAYLNQWAESTLSVPLGTPCARLEGGMYTGERQPTANTCRMPAFPQPLKAGNRRYTIDEELGAMDIFNGFPWLEKTKPDASMPCSNLFRVESGKIRYIHEQTVCATPHCGR